MPPDLDSKLNELDRYNKRLQHWLQQAAEGDWGEALDLARERLVQVVVECAADAGDLWLGKNNHPLGQSATGVFQNLHRAGVMDTEMLARFRRYVSARNRIIHNYDQVTAEQIRRDALGLAQDIPALIRALLESPRPPTPPPPASGGHT
jgi:uncharacterized protein YutE (UPF0331/DUF86 family)